jgi:hypothetical protein
MNTFIVFYISEYHKESSVVIQSVARTTCQGLGSDLPTIPSAEENEMVRQLALKVDKWIWIGLYNPANTGNYGDYAWIDGKPLTYTNWSPTVNSATSGPCVLIDYAGLWYPYNCGYSNGVGCFLP